ncbi:hypothetical protein KAR91_44660 [Candidatus Pacearchaeota archaeon]|nr:hypothetical protein [Candidatus Pacearchaeota archaeon]
MANCHDQFLKYHETIILSKSKIEDLRQARNAIRDRIENDFTDNDRCPVPEFAIQGSYAMGTIINPLDGEYDIDDGVYLKHLDTDDNDNWPTPDTVHKWVLDSVKEHTNTPPIDKRTCVRVVYAGQYHVDLPIYAELHCNNLHAEKGDKGWHSSDPKTLVQWFKKAVGQHGDQLRRMVRYFKAWADYNSKDGLLPSGLIFTVLIVEKFLSNEREDICFGKLATNLFERILYSPYILNPTDSGEDLYERYDDAQKKRFIDTLKRLKNSAADALAAESNKDSCKKWRGEFGKRWTNCDALKDEDKPRQTKAPAILKDDARSA